MDFEGVGFWGTGVKIVLVSENVLLRVTRFLKCVGDGEACGGFCEILLEACPVPNRANARQLQDEPVSQG